MNDGHLRCPSKLHGIIDGDELEVVCKSQFCDADKGVVVLHTFNIKTKELVKTRKFKNPKGN